TGLTTNDFWNTFNIYNPSESLKWSDGSNSFVSIHVDNYVGTIGNGHPDLMFHSFIYGPYQIIVAVTNLPIGRYGVYMYAHGPIDEQNAAANVVVDAINYGTNVTTTNHDWTSVH